MARGIIFDVDGTPVDSNDAHAHDWITACREIGLAVSYAAVRWTPTCPAFRAIRRRWPSVAARREAARPQPVPPAWAARLTPAGRKRFMEGTNSATSPIFKRSPT